jgi:hypothetical protein
VLEVDRPRRPARRDRAKSDQLDAIRAAREALTREDLARPRQRGEREALRVLLATRDSAVRSKRAAITLMKGLLVSASPALREGLRALPTRDQLARCARLRISPTQDAEQRATTIAIRASARRALALQDEAFELEAEIKPIVTDLAVATGRDRRRRDRRRTDPLRLLPPRTHPLRGRVRIARRRRADPSVLRTNRASPPEPLRRPPAQPSPTHDRALPHARRPPHTRLHRTPPSRRTQHPRNQAMPQALHRTPPLPPTPSHTPKSRK